MELCEICGVNKATAWDHDHATGKIRGQLCGPCNIALGLLEDDKERMRKAIAYLERPPTDALYADAKREQLRQATARWRAKHREEERARVRAAYAADPEKFRDYQRRWKRDDADGAKKRRQNENLRKWLAEHPGKREEYNANRREKAREERRAWYREQYRLEMADPEKKAKEQARIRDYKRKQRVELDSAEKGA